MWERVLERECECVGESMCERERGRKSVGEMEEGVCVGERV